MDDGSNVTPAKLSDRAVYSDINISGLHCRHAGVQNKRKYDHIICIKMEVNSQRRKILLFLYTNMAAITSNANQQAAIC